MTQNGNRSFLTNLLQTNLPTYKEILEKQDKTRELITRKKYLWKLLYSLFETSSSAGYSKINLNYQIESVHKVLKNPDKKLFLIKIYLFIFYLGTLILYLMDKNSLWLLFIFIQFFL